MRSRLIMPRYDREDLISAQMAPWSSFSERKQDLEARLLQISHRNPSVVLLRVHGQGCSLFSDLHRTDEIAKNFPLEHYRVRIHWYQCLIDDAIRTFGPIGDFVIGLALSDLAPEENSTPIFTFQKNLSSRNILLPDFELIELTYQNRFQFDEKPFGEKISKAFFAGATTGYNNGAITLDAVKNASFPRLKSAMYFKAHNNVEFRLNHIVQHADAEVEDALKDLGFGGARISWEEMQSHKFLISIDGNGAACSRLALALFSNSVVMKYESEQVLFYSGALQPFLNYIPINSDHNVLEYLAREAEDPGRYAYISQQASYLFQTVMTKAELIKYTYIILCLYRSIQYGE